jgi:DNA-binding transcriptional regulator YdaS (Cro superfamily)
MDILKTYLDTHELTGVEFAQKSGLKQWDISRILTGSRMASVRMAKAIEKATGGAVTRHDLRPDIYDAPTAGAGS